MATHLGNMPSVYHLPTAAGNQPTSSAVDQSRLFGQAGAKVSAAPVRRAELAAKATLMNFLQRCGQPAEYERLTSLTGD